MALSIDGTTGISGVDGSASAPALQGTDSNTGINFASDTVNINTGGTTKASIDSAGALDVPTDFPIKVNGSEKVRISAAGNVGIGASNPGQKLVVQGSGTTIALIQNTDDGTAQLTLGNTGSSNLNLQQVNGDTLFNIAGAERARLKSDGRFGVGLSTLENGTSIHTLNGIKTDDRFRVFRDANGTVFDYFRSGEGSLFIIDNLSNESNTRMRIRNTQGVINYNSSSDYRLKENDVDITDGIPRIKKLRPIRFNWKKEPNTIYDGFFAHEVSDSCPEAVDGTKDEVAAEDNSSLNLKKGDPIYQGVDNSKLIPLLTAALKEAIAKIEVLETKVAALEAG